MRFFWAVVISEQPTDLRGLMAGDIRSLASALVASTIKNPSTPSAVKS
jgi:hypothetical protein